MSKAALRQRVMSLAKSQGIDPALSRATKAQLSDMADGLCPIPRKRDKNREYYDYDIMGRLRAIVTVDPSTRIGTYPGNAAGPYYYRSRLNGTEEWGNIRPGTNVSVLHFDPGKLRGDIPFSNSPYFYGVTEVKLVSPMGERTPFMMINYNNKGELHGSLYIRFSTLEDCTQLYDNCTAFPDGGYGIKEYFENGTPKLSTQA